MVLFDHNGVLRRYKSPEEVAEEFFTVRLEMYVKRKEFMVGTLKSQCTKLDNIARFIKEKISLFSNFNSTYRTKVIFNCLFPLSKIVI